MSKIKYKEVDSGGYWQVLNERKDESVAKQITPLSYVAAAGEMLLRKRESTIELKPKSLI